MADSIFTQIIRGEIPSYKIYEDDSIFAFLDIHPIQPGHTLVVPKEQVEYLWDMTDAAYSNLMLKVKMLASHIKKKTNKPFVGMKVVGIDVPHAHVHLIPFSTAAEFGRQPNLSEAADAQSLKTMGDKLKL